ncbi:cysteine hydrolase (plasmid) [Mesorhizobium sp. AR02]|uniref:cysteine hydrolase family protein n=1 Tax=Mesorhizobium sp. AR02 TaxID=2865837 RepID=UPI00215FDFE3|nr:isochorismatase family cysteine hydrolase [Mesorhizobium sp. AR02]UVK57371.1 cysteine hydrolase [Mesorhizobium sp. AR02]
MTGLSTLAELPLSPGTVHICVDMQRMFQEDTPWALPWMPKVLPNIVTLCKERAANTCFTRFIPARRAGDGHGAWQRYYRRWDMMTIEKMGAEMVDLVPELARFAPPGEIVDKQIYSPWLGSGLHGYLRKRGCDTVVITGGETDMCVLATVLGAADYGYRTIVVTDALCSASDEAHDAMLALFTKRYRQQIEAVDTDGLLAVWAR